MLIVCLGDGSKQVGPIDPVFATSNKRRVRILSTISVNESQGTHEYSIREFGANRKAGQVSEDRSPEKEASDFKNE